MCCNSIVVLHSQNRKIILSDFSEHADFQSRSCNSFYLFDYNLSFVFEFFVDDIRLDCLIFATGMDFDFETQEFGISAL